MKEIVINIMEEDMVLLKDNRYSLCIAFREKDMGYSMISYACTDYLLRNVINIGEELSIFYSRNIQIGEKAVVSSELCKIEPGQSVTIDEYGSFKDINTGSDAGRIKIINKYDAIYPGFCKKLSFSGVQSELPAFVSPYVSVKGEFTMEPEERAIIWFEQFAESGTVIDNNFKDLYKAGKSGVIEVSLSDTPVQIAYENQIWKKI